MNDEAKGEIFYGLHFYSGLAQYQEGKDEAYRVYLTEDTLRFMDPTFAGRPVFVLHVDEIETDLNVLRGEADGWVIESFYNEADGKHWAKFVVVSSKGKDAIGKGYKLSNCYVPKSLGPGGTWNGIDYQNEITEAIYEHLAIVPNPRYEESVIMNPDEFKKYNADKLDELKKLSNSKEEERKSEMKFSFFKRSKVENTADFDSMSVLLPKSSVEVRLAKLINDADEEEMKKDKPKIAEPHHLVDCNGKTMTINDLVTKYKDACDTLESLKKVKHDDEDMKKDDDEMMDDDSKEDIDPAAMNVDEDQDMEVAKKKAPMSEDDKMGEKKTMELEEKEAKEVKDAKKRANALRNANKTFQNNSEQKLELGLHQVQRGKELFGS